MTSILQAEAYNKIRDINVTESLTDEVLQQLGHIFTRHGVHDQFGIALLHRHFDLYDGEVMVHQQADPTVIECSPLDLHHGLTACSWYLNDEDALQPYEYMLANAKSESPSSSFFQDVQEFLMVRGLKHAAVVAVAKQITELSNIQIETLHADRRMMRTTTYTRAETEDLDIDNPHKFKTTAWSFSNKSGLGVVAFKKCVLMASGIHEVRSD
ncbi:hypothetical protein KVT40_003674 [Elsinoe batatas]|uniref:Uncharacterized protein n=1 Tax=Elsinoe batatas TaxID=2601811 RepID=A0A8K0L4Z8_9PEZI|nr:hypothetical protein KVT40_003674 [Elsinoe batatas]